MKNLVLLAFIFSGALANGANSPSGTWLVTSVSCDGRVITDNQTKEVVVANSFLGLVDQASIDQSKICMEMYGYIRLIQNFTDGGTGYQELSSLTPEVLRETCYSKSNRSTLSDTTTAFSGPNETLDLALNVDSGLATITGHSGCAGELKLELQLKK